MSQYMKAIATHGSGGKLARFSDILLAFGSGTFEEGGYMWGQLDMSPFRAIYHFTNFDNARTCNPYQDCQIL